MDDKLTRKSQEALSVAIRRAAADGSPQVEALHLLLALLDQADGTTGPLLRAVGADPALIAKQAEERLARLPRARGATRSAPALSRPRHTVIATAAPRSRANPVGVVGGVVSSSAPSGVNRCAASAACPVGFSCSWSLL